MTRKILSATLLALIASVLMAATALAADPAPCEYLPVENDSTRDLSTYVVDETGQWLVGPVDCIPLGDYLNNVEGPVDEWQFAGIALNMQSLPATTPSLQYLPDTSMIEPNSIGEVLLILVVCSIVGFCIGFTITTIGMRYFR